MLDKLQEFSNTIIERVKSPFIGTFFITWSILHWKIYAILFYSEPLLSIDGRISKVDKYISSLHETDLIIKPVLIAFVAILLYNILNAIALFIKLGYDEWASPYIQKIMNNDKIIERHKFEMIKEELIVMRNLKNEFQHKQMESEVSERRAIEDLNNYKLSSIKVNKQFSIDNYFLKNQYYNLLLRGKKNKDLNFIVKFEYEGVYIIEHEKVIAKYAISDVVRSLDGVYVSSIWDFGEDRRNVNLVKLNDSNYVGVDDKQIEYFINIHKEVKL